MKKITFFICAVSFALISCDPAEQYKSEINEIDSCLAKLDSLETLYDGIEFDSLKMMVEHVEDNEAIIKELYKPDTLDANFGKLMNESKTVRKTMGSVGKDQLAIGDELNAVKHQFMDLKEDILNGLFDDDQIKEYLAVEKSALVKVDAVFSEFYATQKQEKARYYYAVPKVDVYIMELKKKNEVAE